MSTQEIIRDVPADRVEQLISDYVAIGASAEKYPQANGMFTVVATFLSSTLLSPTATETLAEALAVPAFIPETILPKISVTTDFSQLASEYQLFFDSCTVLPKYQVPVQARLNRLKENAPRYAALGEQLGIPWYFIGIIHSLEANSNFSTHLHNGDPLRAKTVHVPAGRPVLGNPPFTWEASARDALEMKAYVGQKDWSITRMLYRWEAYNGFGYRQRGLPSPYLWSFSQHYTKGRFVADHQFDPENSSQQCGAAVLLKALQNDI
jgi:lysozyme family protein